MIIIFVFFLVLSLLAGWQLKRRFAKYAKIGSGGNKSGREIAEEMLRQHGIYNVNVISVEGSLSDHYNPEAKTVNLSHDVYHGRNVAAAAVAAHECGHAVQDAHSFAWLRMRSALVPLQSISGKVLNGIFIAMFIGSILLQGLMPMKLALEIIIVCYGILTLFAFITLPVEIDASRRALAYLTSSGVTKYDTQRYAKDALKWAAYTYVIAALSSLSMLLYYIMIYMGRRD